MPPIYHITTPALWRAAGLAEAFRAGSLESEGLIHASTAAQVEGSANRFFGAEAELVVLEVDPDRLRSPLRWAASPHSPEPFPHVHGPIDRDAIVAPHPWSRGPDGRFRWPTVGP